MAELRPQHTVEELLSFYTNECLPLLAENTQKQRRVLYAHLTEEFGGLPLEKFTPDKLIKWRESLRRRHLSDGSVGLYMDCFRAPFRVAVEHLKWISINPFALVRKPPRSPHRDRILTAEEQERLLVRCKLHPHPHLYLAVLVALHTGMRKDEILQRRWLDIDLVGGVIRLPRTKNKRSRAVPLLGLASEALQARYEALQPQPTHYVFARQPGGRPTRIDGAWRQVRAQAHLGDFKFHDLRHTTASYLIMAGVSQSAVKEILGHSSLAMTDRYVHLAPSHLHEVMAHMTAKYLPGGTDIPPGVPASQPASLSEVSICLDVRR